MTRQPNQNHLNINRRHAGNCPVQAPALLDQCNCPLHVQGRLRGKIVRLSLETRDLATALLKRNQLLADAERPDPTDPTPAPVAGIHVVVPAAAASEPAGDIPLADAVKQFLEAKDLKSAHTQVLYKFACNHFLAWAETHGLTQLKQIDVKQVKAYFKAHENEWKRNTLQSRLTHLRVFFNFCKAPEQRWIQFSPAASRDLNPVKSKRKDGARQPFSAEEIARIYRAIEQLPESQRLRARALILLMLFTGMRISDATFFRRDYIDVDNDCCYYIIKTRKKLETTIELQAPLMKALQALPEIGPYFLQAGEHAEAHQALMDGGEFAKYVSDYEMRIDAATYLVVKVLRLAGVSGACHRFRDTFAVNMLMAGAGLFEVCQFLGHSDVRITQAHYMKFLPNHQKVMGQKTRLLPYVVVLALAG